MIGAVRNLSRAHVSGVAAWTPGVAIARHHLLEVSFEYDLQHHRYR